MADNMHLKFGDIQGESKVKDHVGEMVVLGWSFGATQSATSHVSSGSTAAAVSVRDLKVVKYVDSASPNLFSHCAAGTHVPEAVLTCRKAAGADQLLFLKITMSDCLISKYDVGADVAGNELVKETIEINCAKIKIEYIPQEKVGSGGGGIEGGWNMQETCPYP